MPLDNIPVLPSGDPGARPVATDVVEGVDHQRIKVEFGGDGNAVDVQDTPDGRLPIGGDVLVSILDALATLLDEETLDAVADRLLDIITFNGVVLAPGIATIGAVRRAEAVFRVSVGPGGQMSDAIDFRGYTLTGIQVPVTFDGTQITYYVSADGVLFQLLYDASNAQVIQSVTAGAACVVWSEVNNWSFVKIFCLSAQTGTQTEFVLQGKS